MHRTAVPLILAPLIATACLVPLGALAQTATSATGSSGTVSVETAPTAGQLADRYSTVLGAGADALKVIEGLCAAGTGWGRIARELGMQLGQVVSG